MDMAHIQEAVRLAHEAVRAGTEGRLPEAERCYREAAQGLLEACHGANDAMRAQLTRLIEHCSSRAEEISRHLTPALQGPVQQKQEQPQHQCSGAGKRSSGGSRKTGAAGESSCSDGLSSANALDVDSPSSSSSSYDENIARVKRARTTFVSISEDLVCSISHELMVDPVSTLDGVTYERKEIETWLEQNDTSPATNLRLDAKTLIPNLIAKNTIAKLLASGELEDKVREDWEERKRGVDLIRAQKLFDEGKTEDAAELGHPKAQGVMACLCHHGAGGRIQDHVQSVFWAKKAAAGGDLMGQLMLGQAYVSAIGGLPRNHALALEWFTKAAEQGCEISMPMIGHMYKKGGHGVTKSLETAFSWYQKAAEKGVRVGQFELGMCYYEGCGVTKSLLTARHWFQKSADQDFSLAQRELGIMVMKGEGGGQDAEEAGALWKKAAAKGDAKARGFLEKLKTIHFRD